METLFDLAVGSLVSPMVLFFALGTAIRAAACESCRNQRYCSDIAGQDITADHSVQGRAIGAVRDWLSTDSSQPIPSGRVVASRFKAFRLRLPAICAAVGLREPELTFSDHAALVVKWLKADQKPPDLALLDMQMPELDGIGVVRMLKRG